jgi:hypothetical protein
LGFFSVALVLAVFTPTADLGRVMSSVKSVGVGSVVIDFAEYRHLAEGGDQAATETIDRNDPHEPSRDLFEAKQRLEAKLTYMANQVLGWGPDLKHLVPRFTTVGSLGYDGYLNAEQTQRAYEILSMRDAEFRSLTERQQAVFLAGADAFATTVRVEIFAGWVRARLVKEGWNVEQIFKHGSRYRDLEVRPKSPTPGPARYAAPVFAYREDSKLVQKAKARLAKYPAQGDHRFIVVPPRSDSVAMSDENVKVVTLDDLIDELGEAPGGKPSAAIDVEYQ